MKFAYAGENVNCRFWRVIKLNENEIGVGVRVRNRCRNTGLGMFTSRGFYIRETYDVHVRKVSGGAFVSYE